MGDPIYSFIQEQGYSVYPQIPVFVGKADFVGINKDKECLIVESKVGKWEKALKQALRYGYGAEKAYIALPAPTASNVEKKYRKRFEDCEIGLIEVSEEVRVLIPCRIRTPSFIFKRLILSEVQKRATTSHEKISKFKERYRE